MVTNRKKLVLSILLTSMGLTACNSMPMNHGTVPPTQGQADSHGNPHPPVPNAEQYVPPRVVDLRALPALRQVLPTLARYRVVFVGEHHDRWDNHLNQLEIIRGLHERDPKIAIAMEFFQQPFQGALDEYVAGRIDEREMLRRTEYYERWGFDYRLYQPILRFAREHGLPLVALNLPKEITRKVGKEGLASLSEEERAQIPREMDRGNEAYVERLRRIYSLHRGQGPGDFERFLDVQLLWDEGMADRAARYLREHPDHRLVVLAGSGHLMYGAGIPKRLSRRVPVDSVIVLNGEQPDISPDMGDYLLLPEPIDLPRPGRLGVLLESGDEGVQVGSFAPHSAGAAAGMKEGDVILGLAGEPVTRYADVKIALWDKKPGDKVTVSLRRKRWLLGNKNLDVQVTLK